MADDIKDEIKLDDKFKNSLDKLIDKYFSGFDKSTPGLNLYSITEPYLKEALEEEIGTYHFTKSKKEYMELAVEGSLAASLKYDEALIRRLDAATTEEEKKRIIKDYVRTYVRDEIELQVENAKREIRNNIIKNDIKHGGDIFALFDPRFRGKKLKGDKEFEQYETYRKNVSNYLFPTLGAEDKVSSPKKLTSDLTSSLESFVKEWNDRDPALKGMGTSLVSFAGATSKASRKLIEDDLNQTFLKKLNAVTSDFRAFDSATGKFIKFTDMAILSNISSDKFKKFIKEDLNEKQKTDLMRLIIEGNTVDAVKYLSIKKGGKTAEEIVGELGKISHLIKIDDAGVASVEGIDSLQAIFENSLDNFTNRFKKNQTESIADIHNSYLIANIATLKSMFIDGKVGDFSELSEIITKNPLIATLSGYNETLKRVTTLSDSERATISKAKLSLLKAVTDGVLKFDSEADKTQFVKEINSDNLSSVERVLAKNPASIGLVTLDDTLKKAITLSTDKQVLIKALEEGLLKFENDKDKSRFLLALKENNQAVINELITPKLLARVSAATQIKELLERNELASNIINYTKALKKVSSLSGADQATLSQIKINILKAVSDGVIKFDYEGDKSLFIQAINSGNYAYLKKFVTPGLLGTSVFSRFLQETNEKSLQLAGIIGSKELASRSLNFDTHTNLFRNQVIQNFIYAAQLGFDQGYLVSEIKKRIGETQVVKIWKFMDTPVTWESIKSNATTKFITFVTNPRFFGKYAANEKDITTLLDFYSGKLTFGGLAKKYFFAQLEKRVKTSAIAARLKYVLKFKIEQGLQGILKSKFVSQLKNKLLKNSKFIEKAAALLLNRFLPGAGGFVSKFLKYGGSYVGRYLGTVFGDFGNFFGKMLQGRFDAEEFQKLIVKIALLIVALIFAFLALVLAPMQVIMGALNSLSLSKPNQADYGGAVSLVADNTITGSGVFTSGNACVDSSGNAKFTRFDKDWNNLKISDFEGTRNNKNCRIMCNAKITMGRMFLGSDSKTIDCNAQESILNVENGKYNEFVCSDLIMRSYIDDDASIAGKGLVIQMDDYLKSNSGGTSSKYIQTDLAAPSPASSLSDYKANCIPLDKINPGNIIIYRVNTCNDVNFTKTYIDGKTGKPVTRLVYNTYKTGTTDVYATFGAHVELVLKVGDEGGGKVVYTMSTNNVLKKLTYKLVSCGNDTYSFQVAKGWGYARGEIYAKGDSYPCRMYELRNPSGAACNTDCNIGANNYPDKSNYPSQP